MSLYGSDAIGARQPWFCKQPRFVSQLPVDDALEQPRRDRYDRVVLRGEVRRFERIPCDHRGEIEIKRNKQRARVTVRTLSLGGMGMTFDEWDEVDLERGALVIVHVDLDGKRVDLPGHIAWVEPSLYKRYDLGVVLDLEKADRITRDAYLHWVRAAL